MASRRSPVSSQLALPDIETFAESRPQYAHDRNAIRRGENTLRTGEQPPPGVGSKGFGRKGPKKGSGKPAAEDLERMTRRDEDVDMIRGQEETPWRRRG